MKRQLLLLCLGIALCTMLVSAHEFPLQFTPNSGYLGLVVAGYQFVGQTVVGNCSYYTVRSSGGRGSRPSYTYYNQTCTWDLFGNLLGIASGAPSTPPVAGYSGTETIYATTPSGDSTGTDTALPMRGFVNTPGSHYTWQTSNAYQVLSQQLYTFTLTLKSDGDIPLGFSSASATSRIASASVTGTTCSSEVPVNSTCTVTVTYDPTKICSVSGLAYDSLDVNIITDAGQSSDFVQGYTLVVRSSGQGCPDQ